MPPSMPPPDPLSPADSVTSTFATLCAAPISAGRASSPSPRPLELPLDFPRPAVQTLAGDAVAARVSAEAVAGLEALGRSLGGCTLFQLVLSVWAVLLCLHAGQAEVAIGSPYHGRDAAGSEALIGYFVNMLALRIDAPRGGTVSSLVALSLIHI